VRETRLASFDGCSDVVSVRSDGQPGNSRGLREIVIGRGWCFSQRKTQYAQTIGRIHRNLVHLTSHGGEAESPTSRSEDNQIGNAGARKNLPPHVVIARCYGYPA